MSLFKKVEDLKAGLKVLVYGASGTGKTSFALTFPKIVAIDSENGMSFYRKNPNLKYILNTTSSKELEEALDEIEEDLLDETNTLIIDSITKLYENMQHSALNIEEKRAKSKGQNIDDANISMRGWGKIKLINKRIQATQIALASKGLNVVCVAQEKDIKEKKGDNFITVGYAPDSAKGIEFDYDIILRMVTKKDEKSGEEVYKGEILKDRTQTYKKGTIIDNPSFQNWKDAYDQKSTLKEVVVDFKKDITLDERQMTSEAELLETLMETFKGQMKSLAKDNQVKVSKLLKEKGIDNPLSIDDTKVLNEILDFIKSLK